MVCKFPSREDVYMLNDRHLVKSLILYLSDDFPLDGPDRDIDYDLKFDGERLLVRIGQIWTVVIDLKKAGDLLFLIAGDRWFTRTWTYQEKHCAASLYFLVPIDSHLKGVTDRMTTDLVGNDLCLLLDKILARLSYHHIEAMLKIYNEYAKLSESDRFPSFDGLHRQRQTQKFFVNSYSVSKSDLRDLVNASLALEGCENLVAADRLAIYGHVLRLPYRFYSNKLDSLEFDYSTCVIALMLANFCDSSCNKRLEIIQNIWDMDSRQPSVWGGRGSALYSWITSLSGVFSEDCEAKRLRGILSRIA